MSQIGNNIGKMAGQMSQQGAPVLDQLIDKLMGRHASITYTFENFTIDMPKAQGPHGQQMGSGKISIRGSLTISAELHKKDNDTTHNKIGDEMKTVSGISGNNNNNTISSDISDNTNIPTTTMSTPMVDSSNPASI